MYNLNSHTDEHNQFPIELCITSSVLHYNNLNEKKIWYQMLIHSKSYQKNMAFVCQICSCFQVTTIKCKWHSPCTYHSNNSSTISRGTTLFLYFFYHFLKTVIYTGPWLRLCNFTGPIQPTFFSHFWRWYSFMKVFIINQKLNVRGGLIN